MHFTVLDIVLCCLILLFVVRGLLRGFVNEIAGLVGLFLGFVLAGRYYPQILPEFTNLIANPMLAAAAAYAVIFAAVLIVVALIAIAVKRLLLFSLAPGIDNLLGGIVGTAKGVFISSIALALLIRFVPNSPFLKNSILAEHIDALVVFSRSLIPAFFSAAT